MATNKGIDLDFRDAVLDDNCIPLISPVPYSEDDLALRFSEQYQQKLRYTAMWGAWHQWDGKRWCKDETVHVFDLVRAICRAAAAEVGDKKSTAKTRIMSAQTTASVERLARSDRRHAVHFERWDADPWILNTPGGIVDLHTGKLQPNRPEAHCTKITAVAPGGDCPLWLAFLRRIFRNDEQLLGYVQRWAGYCLTGSVREESLAFCHGTGANGKSTLWNTLFGITGDYSQVAATETFMMSQNERHPEDRASLMGARLVLASETNEGQRWDEARIKQLTGGDPIRARFMRQNSFEFYPQCKLIIFGNHRPSIRTVDEALRRRFHLIPFEVFIPEAERDQQLKEKLRQEWGGILQWAIRGCVEWQQIGLNAPAGVRNATTDYLADQDRIGRWMADNCVRGDQCWSSIKTLYEDYLAWGNKNGERYLESKRKFASKLQDRPELKRENIPEAKGFRGLAPTN
jgi:putative DNA primase/helicase